jgi:hypothetical protein
MFHDADGTPSRALLHGFMIGIAAPVMLFDFGAAPPPQRVSLVVATRHVSARNALTEDMRRVGQDLRRAIDRYVEESAA